jgi:hypothetical protein
VSVVHLISEGNPSRAAEAFGHSKALSLLALGQKNVSVHLTHDNSFISVNIRGGQAYVRVSGSSEYTWFAYNYIALYYALYGIMDTTLAPVYFLKDLNSKPKQQIISVIPESPNPYYDRPVVTMRHATSGEGETVLYTESDYGLDSEYADLYSYSYTFKIVLIKTYAIKNGEAVVSTQCTAKAKSDTNQYRNYSDSQVQGRYSKVISSSSGTYSLHEGVYEIEYVTTGLGEVIKFARTNYFIIFSEQNSTNGPANIVWLPPKEGLFPGSYVWRQTNPYCIANSPKYSDTRPLVMAITNSEYVGDIYDILYTAEPIVLVYYNPGKYFTIPYGSYLITFPYVGYTGYTGVNRCGTYVGKNITAFVITSINREVGDNQAIILYVDHESRTAIRSFSFADLIPNDYSLISGYKPFKLIAIGLGIVFLGCYGAWYYASDPPPPNGDRNEPLFMVVYGTGSSAVVLDLVPQIRAAVRDIGYVAGIFETDPFFGGYTFYEYPRLEVIQCVKYLNPNVEGDYAEIIGLQGGYKQGSTSTWLGAEPQQFVIRVRIFLDGSTSVTASLVPKTADPYYNILDRITYVGTSQDKDWGDILDAM